MICYITVSCTSKDQKCCFSFFLLWYFRELIHHTYLMRLSVLKTQKHFVHPTLFFINPHTEFIIFNIFVNSQFILLIVFPHPLVTSLISSEQVYFLPSVFIFILFLSLLFKQAHPLFGFHFHVQNHVVISSQSLFSSSFANH